MKGAFSLRQASVEYGVNRRRLAAMVARGEIAADTSSPGLVLIPRAELERLFGQPQPIDADALRAQLEEFIERTVENRLRDAITLMFSALPGRAKPRACQTFVSPFEEDNLGGNTQDGGRIVRLRGGQP